jgi:murein DD-endopeptidase MepM/ murein hydrolase activator NlpD
MLRAKLKQGFAQIRKPLLIGLATSFFSAGAIGSFLLLSAATDNQLPRNAVGEVQLSAFTIQEPTMRWGLVINDLSITEGEIKPGQTLSDLLTELGVPPKQQQPIITEAGTVMDLQAIRAGKPYYVLHSATGEPQHLIYEPNIFSFYDLDLNRVTVKEVERETSSEIRTAAGIIEGSLWQNMADNGHSYELIDKMEDALQWTIDFHHLQKGDEYRLVYEQQFVEGQPAGVGEVKAAYYRTADSVHYALRYRNDSTDIKGFYNEEGRPMNRGFLKSPVKYSRISSYYNPNRLHPILKRRRPHYGTDYAAPYGTPIYAVGNGVVTQASYTKGNGRYVRIKHDKTYQTQYLHMQKIARGIRPGTQVSQGQVIGYVGSTGLATGPHVCFRFWKNGRQVNHLRLEFPPPEPLPDEEMPAFRKVRDEMMALLEAATPPALTADTEPEVANQELESAP